MLLETHRYAPASLLDFRTRQPGGNRNFGYFKDPAPPFLDNAAPIKGTGDQRIPRQGFVGREKLFRSQPEVQHAGRSYFETVIVNGYSCGAAAYGVVAMTKPVRQSFASGQRGVRRFVDSFEATRFDPPGDRQCVQKKTLRMREKREGVAMELPVVHKFGTVDALEAGDAKQALRHFEFDAFGTTEQNDCCPQQAIVSGQP